MEPHIVRSLQDGWRITNRSLPGIGVFVGAWIALLAACAAVVVPGIALTGGVPQELIQRLQAREQTAPPADEGEDVVADDTAADDAERKEIERLAGAWLRRAWPMLAVTLLLLVAGSLLIYGGQIGYIVRQARQGSAPLTEFWTAGRRTLLRLLTASGMSVALLAGLVLVVGLLIWLVSLTAKGAAAGVIGAVIAVAAVLGSLVGMVWLGVRLCFWFVAIVGDRLGVLEAVQASFRVTRGRWWLTFGLMAVLTIISGAIGTIFELLSAVAAAVPGPAAGPLALMLGLPNLVINLYLSFWLLAALVRFYDDAKASAASG